MTFPCAPPAHVPSMTVTAHTVNRRRVDEGKENVRVDTASTPTPAPIPATVTASPVPTSSAPAPSPRVKTRARSGSFSYFPGNNYLSGNPIPSSVKLDAASRQTRLPYNADSGERTPTLASKSSSSLTQYHSFNADANRATPIYTSPTFSSLSPLTPISSNLSFSISVSPRHREKEAAARYVAGILINRTGSGKAAQRKRPGVSRHSSKEYVKSSLSSCLTVEC